MSCCDIRCGSHRALKKTLYQTLSDYPLPSLTLQMFLGPTTKLTCRTVSDEDRAQSLQHCLDYNKTFYAHCPYTLNLAKPVCPLDMNCLRCYLAAIKGLPAACVLHVGRVGTIANVAHHLNQLIAEDTLTLGSHPHTTCSLLLEVGAGQGTELGCNWEELRHLYEGLDRARVGLCLDTQHIFAAGMSRLQSHEDIVQLFDQVEEIGSPMPVIHLNDSARPFNAHVDRHAPLTQGYIWHHEKEGLSALIERARDDNLDLVSETGDDVNDLEVLQSLSC